MKAWKELSGRLRAEAGVCEKCGATEGLQTHHVLEKKAWPNMLLEERDLVVLCRRCHFMAHRHHSAEFHAWLASHKPDQWAWICDQVAKNGF